MNDRFSFAKAAAAITVNASTRSSWRSFPNQRICSTRESQAGVFAKSIRQFLMASETMVSLSAFVPVGLTPSIAMFPRTDICWTNARW